MVASAHAVQLFGGCPGGGLTTSGDAVSRWASAHPRPMLCADVNGQNDAMLAVKTGQCRHL